VIVLFSLFLIAVVFASTFFTGWGVLQYLQQQQLFNPIVIRVLIILSLGLVTGLLSRLFFRKWPVLLRMFIPLFTIGLALLVLDGTDPKNYALVFIDRQPWSQPVWIDLVQIGLGYVMSLLALFIGRRGSPRRIAVPADRRTTTPRVKAKSKTRKRLLVFNFRKKGQRKKIVKKEVHKAEQKRIRSRQSLGGFHLSNLTVLKSRHVRTRDVKLLGETEHRCPYCLELVKKNDARGVVICPECKTWHHKDCWDITGSCQVAHRHDL
jgi:hypothetical protein